MKFLSLLPFVPSGNNFEKSKQLFQELGFKITWETGGYIGFQKDQSQFILQNFANDDFASNLMISVGIDNAEEFYQFTIKHSLPQRFGCRVNPPELRPYGKEVNLIDCAGVCWHFVEG
jgi:hypothetical protein